MAQNIVQVFGIGVYFACLGLCFWFGPLRLWQWFRFYSANEWNFDEDGWAGRVLSSAIFNIGFFDRVGWLRLFDALTFGFGFSALAWLAIKNLY
tara:strand:+ start:659 stop:940 length:282 start_codon:yes stop_codon:yes gene_type:complete